MARKATVSVSSNLKELVNDLYSLADALPADILAAGEKQLQVLESAIKSNWLSMVSWSVAGDYVYDSIGYNIDYGKGRDVVGMAGVFLLDRVTAEHNKEKAIKAPQLAYWVEFGWTPNNGRHITATPFLANALYMSTGQQDYVFANELDKRLSARLKR